MFVDRKSLKQLVRGLISHEGRFLKRIWELVGMTPDNAALGLSRDEVAHLCRAVLQLRIPHGCVVNHASREAAVDPFVNFLMKQDSLLDWDTFTKRCLKPEIFNWDGNLTWNPNGKSIT